MTTSNNARQLIKDLQPLPQSWLITGGAGFIGCNLIKRLVAEGVRYIRVLDNLSVGTHDDLRRVARCLEVKMEGSGQIASPSKPNHGHPPIDLFVGDVRDFNSCLDAVEGVDVVVHLAANTGVIPSIENPFLDMQTNVGGTLNMLEAARQKQVKRFIFASSGAPIGECAPPIHEELAPHPVSPYGASKLSGEGYCSAYSHSFGLATVALRFGNVYGLLSSHKSSVVAKFIRQALNGETCQIFGNGKQTRDFIFIDDLVEAIIKSATATASGEIFQIASGCEHTVNEVVEMLRAHLTSAGVDLPCEYAAERPGEVRRNFADTTKAESMLGWTAKTTLAHGLKLTVDWFLASQQ